MVRLSFGPNGEFFIESDKALSVDDCEIAENLYKRVMTARMELDILNDAHDAMNGGV